MDQENLIRSLRLQLRVYQSIVVLGILFFPLKWGFGLLTGRPYGLVVGGKQVACVATVRDADNVLRQIKSAVAGAKPEDVSLTPAVTVERASGGSKPMSDQAAIKALLGKVQIKVKKYAIMVDGVPVVAVDTEDMASEVLQNAKMKFGSLAKQLAEEPTFKSDVSIRRWSVDPEICRSDADSALDALLSGRGSAGSYTVSDGDIAGSIASRHGMSLEELKRLNPGRNLDKLSIGDQLIVARGGGESSPKLVVVVRDQRSGREVIPYTTETVSSVRLPQGKMVELSPGKNGLRDVVRSDIYENGTKVGSDIEQETIIHNPVPRRVAVGVKL